MNGTMEGTATVHHVTMVGTMVLASVIHASVMSARIRVEQIIASWVSTGVFQCVLATMCLVVPVVIVTILCTMVLASRIQHMVMLARIRQEQIIAS
jgi:hypothetical protein